MVKMKRIIGSFFLLLLLASPLLGISDFSGLPDVGERFLDVRSFLFRVTGKNGWSLIVSNDVNSPQKEVKGDTIEEALSNYFKGTPYGYRLFDDCVYVARKHDLEQFFKDLPELEMGLPKGKGRATFSGVFQRIELSFLCGMLRSISGVEIRPSEELQISLMMRAKNISWQRIILAIVHLNRFRINRTDFSLVISPEGL